MKCKIIWGDIMRDNLFNLLAFGQAVKAARSNQKITRDALAEIVGVSVRHLAEIENRGQHPSFQVFYMLATMFNLSVDQYFYPDKAPAKSSQRRILDAKLDELDSDGLEIVSGTTDAILNIRQRKE